MPAHLPLLDSSALAHCTDHLVLLRFGGRLAAKMGARGPARAIRDTEGGPATSGPWGKPSSLLHAAYAMTTPVSLDRTRSVRMSSGRSIIYSTYVLTMAPVSPRWRTAPPVRRAARAP